MDELLAAADANMQSAWKAVLANGPEPGRVEDGGLLLLSSGLPVAMFNQAYPLGPLGDPAGAVARVVEHYARLGAPFALTFRDASSPGLADACLEAGLVEHWQAPLMALDPVPTPPPAPPGLVIEHLSASNADGYAAVLAAGFDAPRGIVDMLFGAPMLAIDGITGFLGSIDGEPVSTSAAYLAHGLVGVYNVATVPSHRGKGAAVALTWAAAAAGLDSGLRTAILQASGDGEPVYQRMGFATPARYRQFVPPSSPSAQNA